MPTSCQPYLPPEWAPQYGVMLTWPHGHGDWGNNLQGIDRNFVDMARHIARFEQVIISAFDEAHAEHIDHLLKQAGVDPGQYTIYVVASNDIWVRDHGPLTVLCSGEAKLLDFGFNGWGGKYRHDLDNVLSRTLSRQQAFAGTPMETVDWILEGGSVEVDGSGTLLSTTSCLLNPNRNPQLNREQLEAVLKTHLGLNRVLWLEHGHLEGDDTDGHIDTLARFCDRTTIAYVRCDDPRDSHYESFRLMEAELQQMRSAEGQPYKLVALPWPKPVLNEEGGRLPANYANFLIINGAVLVPLYNDPADTHALAAMASCFPDREIIGIDSLALINQYGGIHCASMQLPAEVSGPGKR
ncbi:MAG: agmatine deiminase family protein [Gammaproteobacteria bacterium]|nr:agmatine deiminase family protein [Gammaproteobacteria bacterium]